MGASHYYERILMRSVHPDRANDLAKVICSDASGVIQICHIILIYAANSFPCPPPPVSRFFVRKRNTYSFLRMVAMFLFPWKGTNTVSRLNDRPLCASVCR